MKPYQHARISAYLWGGTWHDYIAVHDLIDSTKACFASVQHRFALHSVDVGAAVATRILGAVMTTSEGREVATRDIVAQHVHDDLGRSQPAAAWVAQLAGGLPTRAHSHDGAAEAPADVFAARYHTTPDVFAPLVAWFDQTAQFVERPEHRLLLHNAFGIFLAERTFGTVVTCHDGREVSVRELGERLVIARLGCIPTIQDVARRMRFAPWMRGDTSKPYRAIIAGDRVVRRAM